MAPKLHRRQAAVQGPWRTLALVLFGLHACSSPSVDAEPQEQVVAPQPAGLDSEQPARATRSYRDKWWHAAAPGLPVAGIFDWTGIYEKGPSFLLWTNGTLIHRTKPGGSFRVAGKFEQHELDAGQQEVLLRLIARALLATEPVAGVIPDLTTYEVFVESSGSVKAVHYTPSFGDSVVVSKRLGLSARSSASPEEIAAYDAFRKAMQEVYAALEEIGRDSSGEPVEFGQRFGR